MCIDVSVCQKGYLFLRIFNFHGRFLVDTIKRCLEITGDYNLILNEIELELLARYVELLKVFEIFTVHVQAKNYPTMNTIILFRSEIIER